MSVSTMKTIIFQLIDLHNRLNQMAGEKTEAIKKGDIQSVDRLAHQELPLIENIQKLERARAEEVRQTTAGFASPESSWTFRSWIQKIVPEQEQREWQLLYERLSGAVNALKNANQLNQAMLMQSLQWVKLSINLLQPQPMQPVGYGSKRDRRFSAGSSRIDSRA
ncbi:MAG: flagellar protein FlgN [Sporolactobacillus sp.]